jgi:hypothetical protein
MEMMNMEKNEPLTEQDKRLRSLEKRVAYLEDSTFFNIEFTWPIKITRGSKHGK